ncbi:MAG: 16S rRNA (guanine(966)-N(2))-methyltransferase RsmD [Rhodospirillales bacterium]|nr:16S rRNA (guanine(966)-N(2))-methyltransferase RsmD [Rhodospirillales bacterium]
MRIVGGKHKGRSLSAPKGLSTRPTSDRAREAIFNVLAHGVDGPGLQGAWVLDVFAGTGALGLEALSRGAAHVTFVENNRACATVLKDNIQVLGEEANTTVIERPASALGNPTHEAADYAFLDAPYDQGLSEPALAVLAAHGWLKPGAVVMVEVATDEPLNPPPGFALIKEKTYGAARTVFLSFTR